MKKLTHLLSLLIAVLFSSAYANPTYVPGKPTLDAKGYILQDYNSGYVIAESNADARLEPASLTKMMTAYVVSAELDAGHIHLQDKVHISENSRRQEGSRMFLEVNSDVSVEQLLKGLIVQSGNDAAVALAEYTAGSTEAFTTLMNREAARLGMTHTHFANVTGLPHPDHYSTARDLAHLARALIHDYPDHYSWYSIKKFTHNKITQRNRNRLLERDPTVDGIKTGHTESAGFCLVASAVRNNMRLISVVLGTRSDAARASESQKLLGYGFGFFETHKLYDSNQPLKQLRIWRGKQEQLPVGLAHPLYVTVPRGYYNELHAGMNVAKTIIAPTRKGQAVGNVVVRLGDQTLVKQPLVALQDVPEGGIITRLMDDVRLWFN